MRVDLDGVFYCSCAVSAQMVQRRRGVIINIASVFGTVPARLQCAYTAAKAGVVNFTRSHALEAELANEDVLSAGDYAVRFCVRGPNGSAWERALTFRVPPVGPMKMAPWRFRYSMKKSCFADQQGRTVYFRSLTKARHLRKLRGNSIFPVQTHCLGSTSTSRFGRFPPRSKPG